MNVKIRGWDALRGRDSLLLVLISFLGLYVELTLIRWIPTQVRLLAYFTNFVLIAALLGLGLGMLLTTKRPRLVSFFPIVLLVLTLVVLVLKRSNFVLPIVDQGEFVWNYVHHLPATGALAYLALVGFFLLMVGVFVPLGQEVGLALRGFRPLIAYSLNILGSLLGVLAFALISYLEVPPTLWLLVGAAGFLLYALLAGRRQLIVAALPLALVIGAVHADAGSHRPGVSTYWSPYYEIEVADRVVDHQKIGYGINVNKDGHQEAADLSGRYGWIPYVARRQHLYNLPYKLIHPKTVLVVGAGTGNDVAAALRNVPGARIDAVEIDPVIARLGQQKHPERPYANPRVRLLINDARSFLQQSTKRYDLIVFGLLDSHRVFSHMSSVRMDNYIYTTEAFETVRRHLAPGGMVSVTFSVHKTWIGNRIFTVLDRVFGHAPDAFRPDSHSADATFVNGRKPLRIPPQLARERLTQFSARGPVLTDDWPYLYMSERTIPANYLIVLVLTLLVSILLVRFTVPRVSFRTPANWNFFLLGAAFALQETKGITDIALLFGSTWITNVIVISAILLMILLANLFVSNGPGLPLRWAYLGLFATLLFDYFVPLHGLLNYGFWVQAVASGLRVGAPLFFSGIVFARWFERTPDAGAALGANLMGAVVGGLTEYSSLVLGLRELYLLALAFYGLSFAIMLPPPLSRLRWPQVAPAEGVDPGPGA